MPTITINDKQCDFEQGQSILQIANAHGVAIPQYCFHEGLSVVASCRICLAQIWAPNPRNDGAIEPFMGGKLMPTCQTPAADGMVVRSDSPASIANQQAVMEYLLINHPLDCPVCDQAGECDLQDYSYQYGRGTSRFQEQKVKQPKKDLGPHVYLYADRCIMCTRCVRFTREITGTSELSVQGRGNGNQIDIFPGVPLENELSGNVVDLCPVGALLDKDFLFAQRVWFLKTTPSIDGITASGDNLHVDHNQGKIHRIRPRFNAHVNQWWITDEVRHSWKFVHSAKRLAEPMRRVADEMVPCEEGRAGAIAVEKLKAPAQSKKLAVVVSPMLSCEDAYALCTLARSIDPKATLALGPVPTQGQDKVFPAGAKTSDPGAFVMRAEKAPNAKGVKRVLEAVAGKEPVLEFDALTKELAAGSIAGLILTGNYPSSWATDDLIKAITRMRSANAQAFVLLIDTLCSELVNHADVVLPGATWLEKAGCFENASNMIQAFEAAIPSQGLAKAEGQIAWDLLSVLNGEPRQSSEQTAWLVVDEAPGQVPDAATIALPRARLFNAANVRQEMAEAHDALGVFVSEIQLPTIEVEHRADMQLIDL